MSRIYVTQKRWKRIKFSDTSKRLEKNPTSQYYYWKKTFSIITNSLIGIFLQIQIETLNEERRCEYTEWKVSCGRDLTFGNFSERSMFHNLHIIVNGIKLLKKYYLQLAKWKKFESQIFGSKKDWKMPTTKRILLIIYC